jgi:hypothetical protein
MQRPVKMPKTETHRFEEPSPSGISAAPFLNVIDIK